MNNNNNKIFQNEKLDSLYSKIYKNNSLTEDEICLFCSLKKEELLELINLKINNKICDYLLPYFIMTYSNEIGEYFDKEIGYKKFNTILAETWFSYFKNNDDYKNEFFIFLSLYHSDLIYRISSIIDCNNIKNEFFNDILKYSKSFVNLIKDNKFYIIFGENKNSKIGVETYDHLNRSNYIKNSIELIDLILELNYLKTNDKNIFKKNKDHYILKIKQYINFVKISNYFSNDFLSSLSIDYLVDKNDSKKSIFSFLRKIEKNENGSIKCIDGEYRKPINKNQIIISSKKNNNSFQFIFATLILFTIFGTFGLSYATNNKLSYLTTTHIESNNLNSIAQNNLVIIRK